MGLSIGSGLAGARATPTSNSFSLHPSGTAIGSVHANDVNSLRTGVLNHPSDVASAQVPGGAPTVVGGTTANSPGDDSSASPSNTGNMVSGGGGNTNPITGVVQSTGNIWGGMMILVIAVIFISLIGLEK